MGPLFALWTLDRRDTEPQHSQLDSKGAGRRQLRFWAVTPDPGRHSLSLSGHTVLRRPAPILVTFRHGLPSELLLEPLWILDATTVFRTSTAATLPNWTAGTVSIQACTMGEGTIPARRLFLSTSAPPDRHVQYCMSSAGLLLSTWTLTLGSLSRSVRHGSVGLPDLLIFGGTSIFPSCFDILDFCLVHLSRLVSLSSQPTDCCSAAVLEPFLGPLIP